MLVVGFSVLSASQITALGKKRASKKRKNTEPSGGGGKSSGPSTDRVPSPQGGGGDGGEATRTPVREQVTRPQRAPTQTIDVEEEDPSDHFTPDWSITRGDTLCPRNNDRRVGKEVILGLSSLPRDADVMSELDGPEILDTMCNWFCRVCLFLFVFMFNKLCYTFPIVVTFILISSLSFSPFLFAGCCVSW